ncbi:hypothetical protein Mal4_43020 [Maioricimonas rarisocia]|uniref:Uncharacterized protein n=1 Tax=Maioricimonas rarisocia TaxID=2528026 RepID=A0A517ZBV1_9PLAN|nr:ABC transporter six-transmembrane domain-containing protein [Maioricimonas rarisocia]QDU39948.1 hypothetical protein Mal4_43020 [Maioricimonas rarisocia]
MTAIAGRQGVQVPTAHVEETAPIEPDEPSAYIATRQVTSRQYQAGVLTTAGLSVAESAFRVAQPLVLGYAINGLLSGSFVGLLIVLAQQLGQILAGTARRMSSSRLETDPERPECGSEIVTPKSLSSWVLPLSPDGTNRFADAIPTSVQTLFSVLGALAFLAWYDLMLAAMCGLMTVPALLLGVSYVRKLAELDGNHHRRDNPADTAVPPVASRWERSSRPCWRVRYADAQAIHVGLIRLFTLGALALVLVHAATNRSLPAGDLFAIVCYTLMFMSGLSALPQLLRRWRQRPRAQER